MPKLHPIGPNRFFQYIRFPVEWGRKLWVRGWTQEIDRPFRTSEPIIFRLPMHKALVVGKWTGKIDDEAEALIRATEWRIASYEDFREETGWTPAAFETDDEGRKDFDT